MDITLESIKKKLGFDPLDPPEMDQGDCWEIDDSKPRILSALSADEKDFVLGLMIEKYKIRKDDT